MRVPRLSVACAALLAMSRPCPSSAQVRPLDPVEWRAFDAGALVIGRVGGGVFAGQRASIGGVRGRLLETPAAVLSWTGGPPGRPGRLVMRAIFHPLRLLRVQSVFAQPLPGTTLLNPKLIRDAGDNALESLTRLTPDAATAAGRMIAMRYGVRISTHNDKKGLDRHKTDFYGTVAGRTLLAGWSVVGEAGLGVYGTREPGHAKVLPFLYSAEARRAFGAIEPSLSLVGQASGRQLRGNEDLAEVRAGLRVGRSHWLEATLVRGLVRYSPSFGLLVFAGFDLRER